MGTRCQLGFYEPGEKDFNKYQALIYQHYDGYPEGIYPEIMPILNDFNKNRGMSDLEYASAWLVAKVKTDYLNVGICNSFHLDIEYFYAIYPDKVECYEIDYGKRGDEVSINNCLRLIRTERFKPIPKGKITGFSVLEQI
jgi:hypothetical protein